MRIRSSPYKQGLRGIATAASCLLLYGCVAAPALWQLQHLGTDGTALVGESRGGTVRIACRLNPSDLYVRIDGVRPAPGAQSVWIESGGHTAVLPILGGTGSSAVEAAGPVPETFLFMLNSRVPFQITYGSRRFDFAAFDEPTREALAIACGKSAGVYTPPA